MKKRKIEVIEKPITTFGVFFSIVTFMFWIVYRGIIAYFLLTFMTEYFGLRFGRFGLFLGLAALCWTIYPALKYKIHMRVL